MLVKNVSRRGMIFFEKMIKPNETVNYDEKILQSKNFQSSVSNGELLIVGEEKNFGAADVSTKRKRGRPKKT